jgi:hypothetical protein
MVFTKYVLGGIVFLQSLNFAFLGVEKGARLEFSF